VRDQPEGLRKGVVAVEWLLQSALDKALIPVDDVNYENRGSQLHSDFVFARFRGENECLLPCNILTGNHCSPSHVQPLTERIATASVVVERAVVEGN